MPGLGVVTVLITCQRACWARDARSGVVADSSWTALLVVKWVTCLEAGN